MAVTLTAQALGEAADIDTTTATRLLTIVVALVDHYAPDAPDALSNQAAIRTAGWISEHPSASIRSEEVGDIRTAFAPSMTGAMLHSGAKSLLYPWRSKTGGIAK